MKHLSIVLLMMIPSLVFGQIPTPKPTPPTFEIRLHKIEGAAEKFPFKFIWSVNYMNPQDHAHYIGITQMLKLNESEFNQAKTANQSVAPFSVQVIRAADKNIHYLFRTESGTIVHSDHFLITVATGWWSFVTNSDTYPQDCITQMAEDKSLDPCEFNLEDDGITYYFVVDRSKG